MQRDRRRGVWRLALAAALVAAVASADPTAVRCGPTQATCGPAIVGTGGGGAATGAPSWVNSTLAAWMLDEAAGNARVNAQGTTSRNLSEGSGPIAADTVHKIEGTASAGAFTGSQNLYNTGDVPLHTFPAPFTCGLWAYPTGAASMAVLAVRNSVTNGLVVYHNSDLNWQWDNMGYPTMYFQSNTALNTWAHIVIRQVGTTSTAFKNGVSVQTATRSFTPSTATFFVLGGIDGGSAFIGNVDEAWCATSGLSDASICRICSCGLRGEQCTCNGTAFATTGRNATACSSCTLPSDCSASTPP